VCGEDSFIAILNGRDALLEGAWAGKTGVSEPKTGLDHEWGCRARLDLSAFLKYTRAVYRTVSELVARVRWLT